MEDKPVPPGTPKLIAVSLAREIKKKSATHKKIFEKLSKTHQKGSGEFFPY